MRTSPSHLGSGATHSSVKQRVRTDALALPGRRALLAAYMSSHARVLRIIGWNSGPPGRLPATSATCPSRCSTAGTTAGSAATSSAPPALATRPPPTMVRSAGVVTAASGVSIVNSVVQVHRPPRPLFRRFSARAVGRSVTERIRVCNYCHQVGRRRPHAASTRPSEQRPVASGGAGWADCRWCRIRRRSRCSWRRAAGRRPRRTVIRRRTRSAARPRRPAAPRAEIPVRRASALGFATVAWVLCGGFIWERVTVMFGGFDPGRRGGHRGWRRRRQPPQRRRRARRRRVADGERAGACRERAGVAREHAKPPARGRLERGKPAGG